ncbi:MAG: hypothetical protein QOD75_2837 [Blastocatellia bacterium]|nr:hypothetical protein [Blastocatellia bacterium]
MGNDDLFSLPDDTKIRFLQCSHARDGRSPGFVGRRGLTAHTPDQSLSFMTVDEIRRHCFSAAALPNDFFNRQADCQNPAVGVLRARDHQTHRRGARIMARNR